MLFCKLCPLNLSGSSLPSIHAAKPISTSLLPLTEPPSQTQPLLPLSEPILNSLFSPWLNPLNPLFSPWCAPTFLWVWVRGSAFVDHRRDWGWDRGGVFWLGLRTRWMGGDWGGLLWLRHGSLGLMGFACRGRCGSWVCGFCSPLYPPPSSLPLTVRLLSLKFSLVVVVVVVVVVFFFVFIFLF